MAGGRQEQRRQERRRRERRQEDRQEVPSHLAIRLTAPHAGAAAAERRRVLCRRGATSSRHSPRSFRLRAVRTTWTTSTACTEALSGYAFQEQLGNGVFEFFKARKVVNEPHKSEVGVEL